MVAGFMTAVGFGSDGGRVNAKTSSLLLMRMVDACMHRRDNDLEKRMVLYLLLLLLVITIILEK